MQLAACHAAGTSHDARQWCNNVMHNNVEKTMIQGIARKVIDEMGGWDNMLNQGVQ